jgi:drug/metabolite transporter (DMT)-like permease
MPAAVPAVTAPRQLLRLPLPLKVATFCLIWSAAFSVGKIALADCPPLMLIAARCGLAGIIVLGAVALSATRRRFGRRDLAIFALLGIANYALYLGLNNVGITRGVSAGLMALIISANPILTAVLAAAILDEPLTARKIAGLMLGIAGVAVIVESRLTGGESATGIAFAIGALVALVGGTILFKRFPPRGDLVIGNGVQNLAGGLVVAPVALATEKIGDIVPSARLLVALAFLVLLGSIVAYLLWFHLLTVAGASAASAYHFLMPPLGLMFGWLLLGERIEPFDLAGVVPVALGVWLVTHGARAAQKEGR